MTATPTKPAISASKKSESRVTPAMRQHARFKQQYPDCVLFFRMGDFYEMFHDDALLCNKVLGITLTERSAGVPMAGVPYHAVESYLRKMIEQGHRVAICEQVEDPKLAKGVVERAVTRVLTPGTLIDETLLDESRPNQIAAIQFIEAGEDSSAVLALVELSTGAFTLHNLEAAIVCDEIARIAPNELLYVETANGEPPSRINRLREITSCALTPRPAWCFRNRDARDILLQHFGVNTLSGFGLNDEDPATGPAGALVRYLQETQSGYSGGYTAKGEDSTNGLAHLRPPRREDASEYVTIDAASLQSLEIERTMRTGSTEGSLLATLQRCKSPMGKRLLRRWLCFPIRDINRIERRQRAVGAMIEDRDFADQLTERISRIQDVARIVGRVSMKRATPRDLVALGRSIAELTNVIDLLDQRPAFQESREILERLAGNLVPLADRIETMCVENPPAHMREGGLFRDGIDAQLDEARQLQSDGNSFLAKYQKELVEQTNIPSLKVGYNKVFGYYIEVTHAQTSKVPDTFSRKQTLKNAERYITPQLKEFEEKITTAESRAIEREQKLFDKLCIEAATEIKSLAEFADVIAQLDVLACFAANATRFGYVKPEIVDETVIDIKQGRHPVLDRFLTDQFVPNDIQLGFKSEGDSSEAATLALITGPNMAGKSTFIRQIALITLLAHTGSFVPAASARIGHTDRIFTRIGANDELHAGQSTFMVEMTETANILHHATERSLVILDEIGRGTSTLDGLSLAWAIAETLSDVGCRTLFATHYHELTGLADRLESVRNLHVAVREWGDDIVFLYRILPGRTGRSYGIHVAKIAGLPTITVERAKKILETLVVHTDHAEDEIEKRLERHAPAHGAQMNLFKEYVNHPALDQLRELKLDAMTPLEAFDALRELRGSVEEDSPQSGCVGCQV